jgi:two-component system, sensor histidine kinase and response regulator
MKAMSSVDKSVLDSIAAIQRKGEPDVVQKIINVYISDTKSTVERLSLAVKDGNATDIFALAHKLKSSSANVGARHLSSLFKTLEAIGKENNLRDSQEILTQILTEFDLVQQALARRTGNTGE